MEMPALRVTCLTRVKCVLNDDYIILVPSYEDAHISEVCPVAFSNGFHIVMETTHTSGQGSHINMHSTVRIIGRQKLQKRNVKSHVTAIMKIHR
jgi:hypothetical protein